MPQIVHHNRPGQEFLPSLPARTRGPVRRRDKGHRIGTHAVSCSSATRGQARFLPCLRTKLVDARRGGVIGVNARKVADEPLAIAGGQVQTKRYTFVTPYYV